jgi:hypothetical protein
MPDRRLSRRQMLRLGGSAAALGLVGRPARSSGSSPIRGRSCMRSRRSPRPDGGGAAGRVVGVIADTHGLVRPEALAALAPVTAVRGNNDRGAWAERLHATAAIEIGGVWIYVVHDLHELDLDPCAAGFGAVVTGHSHRPSVAERDGVLYLNPGSAGPRRFRLPIAVARLRIDGGRIAGEVIELAV